MNRTTATGLFMMLTLFMTFTSVFAGHFIAGAGVIDPHTGQIVLVTSQTIAAGDPNDVTRNTSVLGGPVWFTLGTDSFGRLLQWAWDTIAFMVVMLTFRIQGAEAISALWWFLSACWAWLLLLVMRGNSTT